MSPIKQLASQTAIYGLPTIVGRLLNYLLVPLYTYTFTTAEYGTVSELYAYVSFLMIILTYGMETALFNFSRNSDHKEQVYASILRSVFLTSLIFIVITSLFSGPIASIIRYPLHPEYIIWFGMILGMDAIASVAFAKLREQQKAGVFAFYKTVNILVNIALNLFFILYCPKAAADPGNWVNGFYDPQIGIGYIFISNLVASAVTLLLLVPQFRAGLIVPASGGPGIKLILSYALPLMLAGLAGMTNETIDRILIKYLLPADIALSQNGIYGACYKISVIMTLFVQTFRFAAEPFFFSRASDQNAPSIYARVMNYFTVACMIIFLGTTMNISWISYFVGEEFRQGIAVVPILLMANYFLGAFLNLSIWYKLTEATRWGAWLALGGALITLAGNFLFIPAYGYMASAWTTFVCYAVMMVVSYLVGRKYYPVPYNILKLGGYIAAAVLLYLVGTLYLVDEGVQTLIIRNFLVILFVLFAYFSEKRSLLQVK